MFLLKLIPILVVALAVAACVPSFAAARPKRPVKPGAEARRELAERLHATTRPAVLFVGNSYSFGVPGAFEEVCAAEGRTVRTGHSTYGGWTLAKHAEHGPTLKKIRDGRWDVVVLQEQSQIPSFPRRRRNAAMLPAVCRLADEARAAGAIPVLYQTWGRRDGDLQHVRGDTCGAMEKRLAEGYRVASRAAGGLVIVPAGEAWGREVAAGRGGALFHEDGSHPTAAGNRLTARVFYETLFSPPPGTGIAFSQKLP